MKHTFLSIATLALFFSMAIVSCQKEDSEVAKPAKHYNTIITVKSDNGNAKTHYNPSNGAVLWDSDDRISVARGNVFAAAPFELISDAEGVATFGGDLSSVTEGTYYAVYPAQEGLSIDEGRLSCVAIQPQQILTENTFGKGNNTAVGSSPSTAMKFRNVGGLAKIAVRGKVAVKSIWITNHTGQTLAGRGTIDIMDNDLPIVWDEDNSQPYVEAVAPNLETGISVEGGRIFYIVLPPCTLTDYDIDITTVGGFVHHKNISTPTVVSRSAVTMLGAFEVEVASNQSFTVNGVTFNMIGVAGGTFTMGATDEQGDDAFDDEIPTHRVTLSSYYIGQTEVTQALWQAVMGSNPSYFEGNSLPVEKVSWNDCQEFISRLNQITGKTFRLPTEAEWEYAARGGNRSQGYKYSGSNTIDDVAWYKSNSEDLTHTVATKAPNELGLYDMSGNVWEWCWDLYGEYSSSDQTNPTGPSSGDFRIYRGGSFRHEAWGCRVSGRKYCPPEIIFANVGFRLALEP